MKVALVNPPWTFEGSIYFGCREPHLPLELGYAAALLRSRGHDPVLVDGALLDLDIMETAARVRDAAPGMTVVCTAPSYLFWRCPPPELRVPIAFLRCLHRNGGLTVAVGPHGSATPGAVLRKLGVDAVIRGECEEAIADLADSGTPEHVDGVAFRDGGALRGLDRRPRSVAIERLPALHWPIDWVLRHRHHHHRFDRLPEGVGAEVEASRGCPYACTFCAKNDYRDRYRRRPIPVVLEEIDGLIGQGATYVYFIDEIFLPQRPLLEALRERRIQFGVQTRIDLWKPEMLALLGEAGCVSIEAGVESLTDAGRSSLAKDCRIDTEELTERLIAARARVPFVQANLIRSSDDEPDVVRAWRERLRDVGVWSNDPVPLYPYPSSPAYRNAFGLPDDWAWERAHAHYLAQFDTMSSIQDATPQPLEKLELAGC